MSIRRGITSLTKGGRNSKADDSTLSSGAVEAVPEGVVLYEEDGSLLYRNQAFVDLLGLNAAAMTPGTDLIELLSERFAGTDILAVERARDQYLSVVPLHLSLKLKDGRTLSCEHRPLGQGQFMRRYAPVADAAGADGLSQDQMRSLLTGSLQGILVQVKGQVVYVNDRLAELLARSVEELVGSAVDPLIHPDDRLRLYSIREHGPGQEFEFRALKADGSPLWLKAFSQIIDWNGVPARMTSVVDIEDAKQAAMTLRESESRFRHFAEAGSDWFWETDENHVFVDFSMNLEEAVGNAREKMLGTKRTELIIQPRHADELNEHMKLLDAHKPFKHFVYQMSTADGEKVWLRVSGQPFFDEDGSFRGYRGVGSNITAEIDEHDRAQRARELLLTAIDSATTGIAVLDADDRFVFANEAYRRLDPRNYERIVPGTKFEDLLRMRIATGEVLDAVGREEEWLRERMLAHRNPGPPITLQVRDNGWWLVGEHRLDDGSTVVAIADISAEKNAQLAHLASEQRFRDLVDGAPQSIIILRNALVIYANDAASRLHGFSQDELVGMYIFDLALEEDRDLLIERRGKRLAGQPIDDLVQYRALRKDGTVAWLELAGRTIEWEGEPSRQIIETDITERYLSQEVLRSAKEQAEQANRVKSQFLANMSHELRTPLNAIVGFSDMIEQELLGPIQEPRYVEYARDINASGQHLLAIINDILDLSRVEAGQSELEEMEFNLKDAVAACIRLIGSRAKNARIDVVVDLADDLPLIFADERRIKQILINLLSNAVKFTPANGTVTVRAVRDPAGHLGIEVADTGIGMASQDIERAMRPFVQLDTSLSRKFEGTGLGLTLCHMLAEMHQARLTIDSTIGKGTRVTLLLPPERLRDGTVATLS